MRVLVVAGRWDLVGGSERYAGEVVRGLLARGVQVRVACHTGAHSGQGGAQVTTCAALLADRPGQQDRSQLRSLAANCQATLVLSRISNGALEQLLKGPPLTRFVQDHTLVCPGLNKMLTDRSPCEEALGLACLRRYWLADGCSGQQVNGMPALWRPVAALSRALSEIELLGRARHVLVASDYMQGELLRAGLAPGTVEVLPYFTRSNTDAIARAHLPHTSLDFWNGNETFKLFTPARLTLPDKGIDFLLTALGEVPPTAKLVIAGEGPAREWLEHKARAEGLADRVLFSGWMGPEEIEAHYAACDLVVFPSIWNEPFGLVGIEAMAHRKPVVAFDVGGVRQWMVPEETGLAVPRCDAHGLARAIARLQADPALARTFGDRGRARVTKDFSANDHLERLMEILQ